MKNRSAIFIISSVFLFLIGLFFISYAWFDNSISIDKMIIGSTKTRYFAKGTGTAEDPFVIAKPEHMFNLSRLQELGIFEDRIYYFEVSDPITGYSIEIDFLGENVSTVYQLFDPVGNHQYPFSGVFDGNYSTLKNIQIDGSLDQDIGVFGYVERNTPLVGQAIIMNLFIESPKIYSNPQTLASTNPDFHVHNNMIKNRATGYLVGHLGMNATIDQVFVVDPTIDSLTNLDLNRSQYGLIGFNESDAGIIAGGPRDAYSFTLDAASTYTALSYAKTEYGNLTDPLKKNLYIFNKDGVPYRNTSNVQLRLSDALQQNIRLIGSSLSTKAQHNYSLSTIRVSENAADTNPAFLYDKLVADGNPITANGSYYSRENIDMVGLVTVENYGTAQFSMSGASNKFPSTPAINSTFVQNNYFNAFLLFVKPTANPYNLGEITGSYSSGGQQLSYYRGGFTITGTTGNYVVSYTGGATVSASSIGTSGTTSTMSVANAFAAVTVSQTGTMTVVNPATATPDYYVYVIGYTGGNRNKVYSINFKYLPAVLTTETLSAIQNVDIISSKADVLTQVMNDTYEYSYFTFGYSLSSSQKIQVFISREQVSSVDTFIVNVTYQITDSNHFYFDIINLQNKNVILQVYDTQNQLLATKTTTDRFISAELNPNDLALIISYNSP